MDEGQWVFAKLGGTVRGGNPRPDLSCYESV